MQKLIEHILIFRKEIVPFILHLHHCRLLFLKIFAYADALGSNAFNLCSQTISLHPILIILSSAYTMLQLLFQPLVIVFKTIELAISDGSIVTKLGSGCLQLLLVRALLFSYFGKVHGVYLIDIYGVLQTLNFLHGKLKLLLETNFFFSQSSHLQGACLS